MDFRLPRFTADNEVRRWGPYSPGELDNDADWVNSTEEYRVAVVDGQLGVPAAVHSAYESDMWFLRPRFTAPGFPRCNRLLFGGNNFRRVDSGVHELRTANQFGSAQVDIFRFPQYQNAGLTDWRLWWPDSYTEADLVNAAGFYEDRFHWTMRRAAGDTDLEFGEVVLGSTWAPSKPPDQSWVDMAEPLLTRQRLRNGNAYTTMDGPPRRRYTLEFSALDYRDKALFDQLLRDCAYGALPFWYEHPGSGDGSQLVFDFGNAQSAAHLTTWRCVTSPLTGPGGDAEGARLISADGNRSGEVYLDIEALHGGLFDLRHSVLSLDYSYDSAEDWLVDAEDLYIGVDDSVDAYSYWEIGGQPAVQVAGGLNWFREFIDMDQAPTLKGGGNQGQADLSKVARVRIFGEMTTTLQSWGSDNLRLWRKEQAPVLVKLASYSAEHDGTAARAFGMTWRIRMELLEVTA